MKAAVMRATDAPLEIEEVRIDDPGPGEVEIRTAASGLCHSDLHVIEGALPMPPPCILGHEPSGVVERVGEGVTAFAPGDHVIGCLSAWCGRCDLCLRGKRHLCVGRAADRAPELGPRLRDGNGDPILQFTGLSSFAEQMLCSERSLVKIRPDMPLDRAALIGCGVTTGLGAALKTARVQPGASTAVIGCGGVGLSAVQGSRIAGAGRIVAVDMQPWKLDLAKSLGATDVVDASKGDPVAQVMEATGGGVDYAFECIGLKATVEQAIGMAKRGGTAVLVGVVPLGQTAEFHPLDLVLSEKRIQGSMMGSNVFQVDMPTYVDFYMDGRLRLDEMISGRISLDRINDGFDGMRKGEIARSVITFD